MFIWVRQNELAEPKTGLRRLKVKVIIKDHGIYLPIHVHSIFHEPFQRLS